MKKTKNKLKYIAMFVIATSVSVGTALKVGAITNTPNWESLYKSKIQQIENEYKQGKRTKDTTYDTLFFSLQDFNFDGIPELYHALIHTDSSEYELQEGSEEIYYIKNNKVVLGKIGNHATLGLLPANTITGTLTDRRGQFAMYHTSTDTISFITKDSWTSKSNDGKVTISKLEFDAKSGMLTVNEILSNTYSKGNEPSKIDGYMYIDAAACYSKCNDKNCDIWLWEPPYVIAEEKKAERETPFVKTTSWKDAYEKFILDKGYAKTAQKYYKTNENQIKFALYDFDGDNVPEMIVKNGAKNENEMVNYIYVYKNEKVVYLGKAGEYDSDFMYVPGYPGLVWTSGKEGKYVSYYYDIKNDKLVSKLVMEETIDYVNNQMEYSYVQKTKDDKLYIACKNAGKKLNMYSIDSINIEGWNNFVSDVVKSNSLFADVNANSWFYDAVKFATEKGLMSGITPDLFEPESNITRSMFITMLYRLEGEQNTRKSDYSDVGNNEWYANSISWATQKGIANGVSNTAFAPNENMTREQLLVFLYRYAKFKNKSVSASNTNIKNYFDNKNVAAYAKEAMNWAVENGFISGESKYYLQPSGNASRAQAAVILQRFCEKYKV